MAEDNATVRLLSYRELMLTLQGLCKEKRSGIMLIRSDSGSTAQVVLDDGVIFDAVFDNVKGHTALTLIKQIQQGKASFLKRLPGSAMREIYASTAEVFQLLIDNVQSASAQSAVTPPPTTAIPNITPAAVFSASVPSHSITPDGLVIIEAYLAAIIGPIARPIYSQYKDELQQADNLNKLNAAIEQITKQVLAVEQQKAFKENIRGLIYQYSLIGQHAVLKAFKTVSDEFRLQPMTLSLLVCKYAAHGESGTPLLGKLAPQLELLGNLAGIVLLVDVLRFLEKTGRSGFVEIHAKEKRGFFYFDQGVLVNAVEEDKYNTAVEAAKSGTRVAMDMLQWQADYLTFTLTATVKAGVSRAIHQSVDVLAREIHRTGGSIISREEGLKYIKGDNAVLSSDALQSAVQDAVKKLRNDHDVDITQLPHAIKLAESYDLPNAEQIINRILLVRDNSALAWLWLSRVLTNMAAIEFALKKAVFLDSKNSELAEEVKKFTLARKVVKSNFVLRCPFCWTPVAAKDSECAYCEADFFISSHFFSKVGKANTDILDKAIARYDKVLQHNTDNAANVYAHFYLAMAYLNRKYYQEGLAQFYELISLLPENRTLIEQGGLLSGYMTSAGLLAKPISQQAKLNTDAQKSKILVVEDSMVTRKVIARTLAANGYEVFEAKDSIEALTDIETRNPDLVLLDIILPGKDGYEILAEIRQKPTLAKTPVIMLTSRDSLFDKIKGKVSDANEYLTKPFKPDELLLVVKKYLK